LFDPRFFLYYEEVDLCRAAKAAGWTVRYCPETDVVHIGGESARSEGNLSTAGRQLPALQVESELLYFRKHYGLPGVLGALTLGMLGDTIIAAKQLLGRARGSGRPFSHSALAWVLFVRTRLATRPTR
jgi:N-acetylglucosaminyl-diphospho-decaprenol L-rhamnosyltransferase